MKSASKDFDFFLQKALFSLLSVHIEAKLQKEWGGGGESPHVKDWAKTIEERGTFLKKKKTGKEKNNYKCSPSNAKGIQQIDGGDGI